MQSTGYMRLRVQGRSFDVDIATPGVSYVLVLILDPDHAGITASETNTSANIHRDEASDVPGPEPERRLISYEYKLKTDLPP
jgi:hypothetical protein